MAELQDMFLIVAVLLGLGISMVASFEILDSFQEANNQTQAINQTILEKGLGTIRTFDLSFAVALMGAGIALLLAAFFIDQHPAFLGVNLLIFIILIFVAAQLSNTFITFASVPSLVDSANQFPTTVFIWQNLPLILMFLATATMIVGFSKVSNRRGGV